MHKAYSIANELLRDKLKEEAPDILADLDDINESDVIVTVGQHDRIESVFSKVNTPHNLIHPAQLRGLRLDPDQIVFVNCPGNFDDTGLRKLNRFVKDGGFLFTTDWALKHVLEQTATVEQQHLLLEYLKALPDNKPPKGDAASWQAKTRELIKATKAVVRGREGAIERLTKASNCKACHTSHKVYPPETKK